VTLMLRTIYCLQFDLEPNDTGHSRELIAWLDPAGQSEIDD
jgi:hypothetical protein